MMVKMNRALRAQAPGRPEPGPIPAGDRRWCSADEGSS